MKPLYIILLVVLVGAVVFSVVQKLEKRSLKVCLSGLIGALIVGGEFLLVGLVEGETLREHFIFPEVLALSAYLVIGAVTGMMLSHFRSKKANNPTPTEP